MCASSCSVSIVCLSCIYPACCRLCVNCESELCVALCVCVCSTETQTQRERGGGGIERETRGWRKGQTKGNKWKWSNFLSISLQGFKYFTVWFPPFCHSVSKALSALMWMNFKLHSFSPHCGLLSSLMGTKNALLSGSKCKKTIHSPVALRNRKNWDSFQTLVSYQHKQTWLTLLCGSMITSPVHFIT